MKSIVLLLSFIVTGSCLLEGSWNHNLSFQARDAGELPPWLSRPVPNTFQVVQVGGRVFLTGESGRSAEYQLVSSQFVLRKDTEAVRLQAQGRVRRGALYLALLDDDGNFVSRPENVQVGLVNSDILVSTAGTRHVRFVLGNAARDSSSAWDIYGLTLEELTRQDVEKLVAARKDDLIFGREYLGTLPPTLSRPSPNSLKLVEADGKILLAGETTPTEEYQIVSKPFFLRKDTVLISLQVEGSVESGGIYYAFLDHKGNFYGPVMYSGAGPIVAKEILMRSPGKPVSFVLGHSGSSSSRWRISAIHFNQLNEQDRLRMAEKYAQKAGFLGSGWWWALQVLKGKIGDPADKTRP